MGHEPKEIDPTKSRNEKKKEKKKIDEKETGLGPSLPGAPSMGGGKTGTGY